MHDLTRRDFVRQSAALASVAWSSALFAPHASAAEPSPGNGLKKAVKLSMVKGNSVLEKFQLVKDLGYDGIDVDGPPLNHDEVLQARDKSGLFIHGVVDAAHWAQPLSHPDPEVRKKGLDGLFTALRDAKAYGGNTVLLVPGVVNKQISYDDAYKRSQVEIRKALPLAEELGIKIAFENVWNMFLLSPLEMQRYIDEFESPWVGAYFDVGNVVNYGWPEQWIRILGKRVLKIDVKEYSRAKRDKEGPYKGFAVPIGEGDCDWPAVLAALHDVGYTGFCTAEVSGGGREELQDIAQRMDRVLELKKA